MKATSCRIEAVTLDRGVTGLALENEQVRVVVLPGKGGDITSLIVKPEEIELLWQSPWGHQPSGGVSTAENSQVAWLDAYQGGWQEIFPSGGGPCHYKGVELYFHGEASTSVWDRCLKISPAFSSPIAIISNALFWRPRSDAASA